MAIETEVQKLAGDALVTMYEIDTTPIGGTDIYRFTGMPKDGGNVTFGGVQFTPIDMEATGFKWDGRGGMPKPKFRISNVGGLITAAIITHGDLVGSKFTRIRTYAKYLDDGATPDPNVMFPPEIYTVNQRTAHTKLYVEWQLASPMEQLGVKLPRRQCIRETCTHRYRIWDPDANGGSGAFDYSNATCPYVAAVYWDENGVQQGLPSADDCGRTITDCKLRFGEDGVLPTRAFPGISRLR